MLGNGYECFEGADAVILHVLAEKIRSQREKRKLKQQDIAHALNVSPQAVSKWERAENAPDIAVLAGLAKVLGVTIDWLLEMPGQRDDVFEATVLVSSVAGAYEMSLGMEARDFATWANGMFYVLTEATLRHGGVPIKYMGDQYLCFFTGAAHAQRAHDMALNARRMVREDLQIGLSTGEIYLGAMGHPDYARPDIMGEVVNMAFLTLQWAEAHADSGIAATQSVVDGLDTPAKTGQSEEVEFRDIAHTVRVYEIFDTTSTPSNTGTGTVRRPPLARG